MTPTPDDRAKQWLGLVDDQNYADAYKQLGASHREQEFRQRFCRRELAARVRRWAPCRRAP